LIDALLPRALGRDFRFIWSSSTLSNLSDGVLLAVGPLLVASVTRQPLAVAMAIFALRLPWVLFGVMAGAVIDRIDRRALMVVVNLARAGIAVTLAVVISFDLLSLTVIYLAMFLIGTAETFADNASSVLVAVSVPRDGLGTANSRLFGASTVTNQLAGPPLGALLFGVGIAAPFVLNAVLLLAAAVTIARIATPVRDAPVEHRRLRHEIAEGVRWLWADPPVRTLAIMIAAFNVTFGAAFAVWVLYAYERLGLGELGFGLLMTAGAVGGLAGSAAFRSLELRYGYTALLRAGLIVESLTHLALALTRSALVAGVVLAVFGLHSVVWGTTATTVRQRAVPAALLGRITSVYLLGSVGAVALGTLLGGVLAQRWGILAPFWFAGAGAAVTTLLVWRSISHVGDAVDRT
jgi:predicted MFS family arabinose efflux permease